MKGMNFGLKVFIGCMIAVVLVYSILIWGCGPQLTQNAHNIVYWIGPVLAAVFYRIFFKKAYAEDDGPNTGPRIWLIVITVFLLIWAGGWIAGANEKVAPGSPQMEELK